MGLMSNNTPTQKKEVSVRVLDLVGEDMLQRYTKENLELGFKLHSFICTHVRHDEKFYTAMYIKEW